MFLHPSYISRFRVPVSESYLLSTIQQGDRSAALICSYWTEMLIHTDYQSPFLSEFELALLELTYSRAGVQGSLYRMINGEATESLLETYVHCLLAARERAGMMRELLPKLQTPPGGYENVLVAMSQQMKKIEQNIYQTVELTKQWLGMEKWQHIKQKVSGMHH